MMTAIIHILHHRHAAPVARKAPANERRPPKSDVKTLRYTTTWNNAPTTADRAQVSRGGQFHPGAG